MTVTVTITVGGIRSHLILFLSEFISLFKNNSITHTYIHRGRARERGREAESELSDSNPVMVW